MCYPHQYHCRNGVANTIFTINTTISTTPMVSTIILVALPPTLCYYCDPPQSTTSTTNTQIHSPFSLKPTDKATTLYNHPLASEPLITILTFSLCLWANNGGYDFFPHNNDPSNPLIFFTLSPPFLFIMPTHTFSHHSLLTLNVFEVRVLWPVGEL